MRISSAAVLVGIIVSSTIPAMAFYPDGTIDKNLSYDSIEIDGIWVTGKLYNQTSKSIKVEGAVRFVTIHKQVINYAQINVTVPPNSFTPTLQKSEAFSLCVSKGEAVVNYCDPLIARRLGASGFPAG